MRIALRYEDAGITDILRLDLNALMKKFVAVTIRASVAENICSQRG